MKKRKLQNIQYQKRKLKKVLIILASAAFVLIAVFIAGSIELPLPENERGTKLAEGNITSCKIQKIGRGFTASLSVKIYLSSVKSHLLVNDSLTNRDAYEKLCSNNSYVKIKYHANRLLLRPRITYIVESVDANHRHP